MVSSLAVPSVRITRLNHHPVREDGDSVVYWMTAFRRLNHNFALQRAVELAVHLGKPLIILEALRCDYPWASVRFHQFVIEGMRDNAATALRSNAVYLSFVESFPGEGRGLVEALSTSACAVVGDDFPCFFLPAIQRRAAATVNVSFEVVDSNGLLPMRSVDHVFPTAYAFRRHLQKTLTPHLSQRPVSDPLSQLPRIANTLNSLNNIRNHWRFLSAAELKSPEQLISGLPVSTAVGTAVMEGGTKAGQRRLEKFLSTQLPLYGEERNHPDSDAASGLSPYLHFGHVSSHQVFEHLADQERWTPENLSDVRKTKGSREGWWGMSTTAESFLDELVTWRELGFNMCWQQSNYDQYDSLPTWAQQTLAQHAADPRPWLYSLEELDQSRTHDRIWNAAQNQLVTEGRMHNYLRMLWGKKILEWSPSPQEALIRMIELNNRYAVDGRDPNSYSGIFWVLGRYDRAWGPERPIYGKIRYMTSDSTERKLNMTGYLRQYARRN